LFLHERRASAAFLKEKEKNQRKWLQHFGSILDTVPPSRKKKLADVYSYTLDNRKKKNKKMVDHNNNNKKKAPVVGKRTTDRARSPELSESTDEIRAVRTGETGSAMKQQQQSVAT
jgi:hypothetical protein